MWVYLTVAWGIVPDIIQPRLFIVATVLFALLAATFVALCVAWLKRLPTLRLCPTCTRRTCAVLLPTWLRPLRRWVGLRWCPNCEWQGIGRKGPEFIPGHPLAHDSGFHWGADIVGEDSGFRWAEVERPEPNGEAAPNRRPRHTDGPAGFHWRRSRVRRPPPQ